MILEIIKEARAGSYILANGCFLEVYLASLFYNFSYTAKVPGDIVWERARTSKRTSSDIEQFQQDNLGISYKIFRTIFSRSLIKAKNVIVPSKQLKVLCSSWGVKNSKLHVIGNSVDTAKFKPKNQYLREYDFVTVCRLVPWKGVTEIINCALKLNASLLIIGDGPERENLQSISSGSKSPIDFLGTASREEVFDKLNSSRAFILNSSFEATSYSLLEAMACGLPVIANESTGSVEIITHEVDGFLCGQGTGLILQEAMSVMMNNPEIRDSMGLFARQKVLNYFSTLVNFPKILKVATDASEKI
jgi:glycosyltransferase involved in cell wall biosynthesis